jgi:hypothetical protein
LDDKCKYTNYLDERFNKLKCMDEINSKIVMLDEKICTWMKVIKWMKCLDENGTSMNFLDDKWR